MSAMDSVGSEWESFRSVRQSALVRQLLSFVRSCSQESEGCESAVLEMNNRSGEEHEYTLGRDNQLPSKVESVIRGDLGVLARVHASILARRYNEDGTGALSATPAPTPVPSPVKVPSSSSHGQEQDFSGDSDGDRDGSESYKEGSNLFEWPEQGSEIFSTTRDGDYPQYAPPPPPKLNSRKGDDDSDQKQEEDDNDGDKAYPNMKSKEGKLSIDGTIEEEKVFKQAPPSSRFSEESQQEEEMDAAEAEFLDGDGKLQDEDSEDSEEGELSFHPSHTMRRRFTKRANMARRHKGESSHNQNPIEDIFASGLGGPATSKYKESHPHERFGTEEEGYFDTNLPHDVPSSSRGAPSAGSRNRERQIAPEMNELRENIARKEGMKPRGRGQGSASTKPSQFAAAPEEVAGRSTPTSSSSLPKGWIEAFTPEGVVYYVHKASGNSCWERPVDSKPEKSQEGDKKAPSTDSDQDGEEMKHLVRSKLRDWCFPNGKSGSPRSLPSLLSSLHSIVPDIVEQGAVCAQPMANATPPKDVKKAYMRAVRLIHPDKVSNSVGPRSQLLAEGAFICLNEQWEVYRAAHQDRM
jgi:hypothetical protein